VTTSYDTARLLRVQYSVPGLIPVNYGYDDFGRLVSLGIGSRLSTTAYDGNGNPDYLISTDNQTFDYTYDIMDRLRSDARPDGSKVDYQYDANGNLQAIDIYGDGSFSFGYTANNQRNNYVQPISGAYKYSYDRDRRLKGIITPSGEMITNSYVNGNLATSTTPEGVTRYSYLCASRPEKIGRNGESISFGYDGPLVTSDTRSGSVSGAITYLYNSDFLVTTMTYAGSTVALGYDSDGLLTSAGGFSIARNIQNGLAEGVSGVGLTQARIYNGYAELDGLTSSVSGAHPYAWSVLMRDNNGRIRQRQETINGSTTTWEYAYNPIGRLTDVKKDGVAVESYAYDLNGNRLTEINTSRGIIGRSFGYSDEDHVLTAGSEDYQFDVDGFLQSKTTAGATTSYSYSSLGELQTVWLSNGDILSYLHDPMGRRIAKKVNGAIVEKYLWKDLTTLLAVYDGADNLLQRFNYADGRVPVSMTAGGATYFLLTDQVGTLRAVVDSTGTIVKRIDYDSFGNIISDSNPGFSVPFGFAGGLHDRDTGLVRFGARDYDPAIGRFVAKDPIDFAGGDTNLYAYVMSDPVNMIDPGGLWGFGLIGSGSAEVGLGQGAGATGSLGGGLFGGGPEGLNPGGFASFGAMRGGLGEGKGYPCSDPDNFIGGGFVGAGGGAFFTNATSASGLKGPFYTASFNIAFPWLPVKFSAQLGWSGGTWIGSVTFGPGFGMSASGYKTNTWTTP
jgi:RHS repeat-associated protein